jgi:hypothetical protein
MRDIYVQRVDAAGSVLWTADGKFVCADSLEQLTPYVAADGVGGAIIAWNDYRDGTSVPDIYAQRFDASGDTLWAANGVAVVEQPGSQWAGDFLTEEGGAIFAWGDYRGADNDIYAQKLDASGNPVWTENGVALCTAAGTQKRPAMASDGSGGIYVFWSDDRSSYFDIYGQHVHSAGVPVWTPDGQLICTSMWNKEFVEVISDQRGGSIVAWTDMGDELGDVFAQRVDAAGTAQWGSSGVPVCAEGGEQIGAQIISDGVGGVIAAWADKRAGNWDVYAQRVTRQGYWGYPCPMISSIEDIPADQGGQTWMTFDRSRLDIWQTPEILQYTIWKNLGVEEEAAMKRHGVVLSSPAEAKPEMVGKALYYSPAGGWALVGATSAYQMPEYGYVAMTLRDSTSADPALEYYFVSAMGFGLADHWESPVMAGYSVDNLAPGMPLGLAASHIGDTGLWIHWNPNPEDDVSHYAVYRGTHENFVPDQTSLIGTAADTVYIDENTGGIDYYYKISAFDVHENEGPRALLTPDMITGTVDIDRHYSNALFQNAPNPFTSSTAITFSIEKEGRVRLSVFDAKGRLVRVLVNDVRSPQRYVEEWDGRDSEGRRVAAGTYFYRLEIPGWTAVKKMTTAR